MDQTEITAAIRKAIREPTTRNVKTSLIVSVTLRAVKILGLKIKEKDPSYYNERVSLTSDSNVFSFPSGCKTINKIWDYSGTATTITGAADNGSGLIRMTNVAHVFSDTAIITQHDVAGCTEANGTWKIDYVDANTYDLLGSTFSNAYTSGGKAFLEKSAMTEIIKINMSEQSNSNSYRWYPRKREIILDDVTYNTSDIIVDYEGAASAITDIPDEYHEYLISWPVVQLMDVGKPVDPGYDDKIKELNFHRAITMSVLDDISRSFKASSEPSKIRNVWSDYDDRGAI